MDSFDQKDFERYVMERRMNDPRYQNIPINSDIHGNEYNVSSSDESADDDERKDINTILSRKIKGNKLPKTIIKKNTLIINSLDRDLNDMSQNRFNFKVKFAPSSDSYKKKFPIHENSEFFLQTEYQKKLGIQGFYRNINEVKIKDELKVNGYSTAFRQCSEQPGNMFFNPSKPLGEFLGYNYLYESSDSNGANIQKKFNAIQSIEIKKLIVPNKIQTYTYNTTLYGSIWNNVPYVYVRIPELSENYNSTTPALREAFSVLVKEKETNNLEMNPLSYITFVPINDNVHIYTPPKTGINLITIELYIPPTFLYIPNSISTSSTSDFDVQEAINNGFFQENYNLNSFGEIKNLHEIVLIDYKQESAVSSWERRATLSGVNQPSSFLQERSIYDCPPGSLNKSRIYAFALITKEFFNKDTFFVGSSIKLVNYIVRFNQMFSMKKTDNTRTNPMSVEYYIPDLFYDKSGKNSIWSSDEIRDEGKDYLINTIHRLINRIGNFFSSKSGMPIIEIGHIDSSQLKNKPTSNNLRNCYEYLNNYIGLKKLGLEEDKKPYCNILNTNINSEPYNCECIDDNEFMYGFCDQITAEHFGDEGFTFKNTDQGFYKGINKDYRPEGTLITGTKNTSSENSLYNKELLKKYCVPIVGNKNGTLNYYYNIQGIPNIKNAGKYNKIIFSRDGEESTVNKNINLDNNSLKKYHQKISSNLDEFNSCIKKNSQIKKIDNFSNNLKLLNLTINNFFYEIISKKIDLKILMGELESTLENFYISYLDEIFNINYKYIKKNLDEKNLDNPLKIINSKLNNNTGKIFKLWFEIMYYIEIIIDMLNIIVNGDEDSSIKERINSNYNEFKNFLFKDKKSIQGDKDVYNNEIKCDDVCLDWFISIKDDDGNIIRESCAGNSRPFLPDNNNDLPYPDYQNNYCNGKENKNNICKPCSKYVKGPNSDGMCNVMLVPFPTTFFTEFGRFSPFGLFEEFLNPGRNVTMDNLNKLYMQKDLLYNNDDKSNFYQILNYTSLLICKNILYNGGPLSFPVSDIGAGNVKKNCKVVSVTQQNTFVFEMNEVIGNINKII